MNRILSSLLTLFTFASGYAQSLPPAPKLVVGITIDQLRTDYIESFANLFGEGGFKRLWREGRVYRNAEFNFPHVELSSAIATLYTGSNPSQHGIVSNKWMDLELGKEVSCVQDEGYIGYYTDQTSSAVNLLASTLSDELKIASLDRGIVYSIAPTREAAILTAGHAADGAFWLNDNNGKWCGTTYYKEFPWWVNKYNERNSIDFRVDKLTWKPMLSLDSYKYLPVELSTTPFKYNIDGFGWDKYRKLKTTPLINDEVNSLVDQLLEYSGMGANEITDLLMLTYYAGNFDHKSVQEASIEMQDAYVRLDHTIEQLLTALDQKVGLHNTLIFVTSTGYSDSEKESPLSYKIPSGEFHPARCCALLNLYLMAKYGEGQYIDKYYNQQIYFNTKLLEQKDINKKEIQDKAAEFVIKFSGVQDAFTSYRLLLGAWTTDIQHIKNGYHNKRSGDLLLQLQPGWKVINEEYRVEQEQIRSQHIPAPVIFFGTGIKPEIIQTPIQQMSVIPTISRLMRIRAPNASSEPPLTGISK